MKILKIAVLVALVGISTLLQAQYSQLGKKNEFMLKIEAGYAPFMGNMGEAGDYGFYVDKYHNAIQTNVMAGLNISQDWFVGLGAGFNYLHNTRNKEAENMMGVNFFADMDFRPIWKAIMGLDYQPTSIKWAPLIGVRAGGSLLMGDADKNGTTFTPMAEVYAGLNWYYWYFFHGMRNMTRNWHSFYVTIGLAYMQQAVFLPVRLGWRW